MKYSDYQIEQITSTSTMYESIAQKLISLAKDGNTKRKIERNFI